jgi:prepilin-type N-terminal cleavage/methylation domain-containing protein
MRLSAVETRNSEYALRTKGMTLTEVIVASSLLVIAMVPILRCLSAAQAAGRAIECRSRSLALAQGKLDEIRARCLYYYDDSFGQQSASLGGSYLCTVEDDGAADLRQVSVSVGFDKNGDGSLGVPEIQVTLTTYIARREPGV